MKGDGNTVATVATSNHLPAALALFDSVRERHPDLPFHLVLVDRAEEFAGLEAGRPGLRIIDPARFEVPRWKRFVFQYDAIGLCCALKAWSIRRLLDEGFDKVIFLDSDIAVYESLDPIFELLDRHSLLLTPHLKEPPPLDGRRPTSHTMRMAGVFNGGFMAATHGASERFLDWLKEALMADSIISLRNGLLHDQTFLAQACAAVDDLRVLNGAGFNVAYWNLHERTLNLTPEGRWMANGETMKFFHFSGMPLSGPLTLSRHQDRFEVIPGTPLERLLTDYRNTVDRIAAEREYPKAWLYDRMIDGTPVKPGWRECVRLGLDPLIHLDDPFTAVEEERVLLDEAAGHDRVTGRSFDPLVDSDFDKSHRAVVGELEELRGRFERLRGRPIQTAVRWLWRRVRRPS